MLSSYYILYENNFRNIRVYFKKNYTQYSELSLQTRAKMKILKSVLIDDYFNFSSTCKCEISIHLLRTYLISNNKINLKIP